MGWNRRGKLAMDLKLTFLFQPRCPRVWHRDEVIHWRKNNPHQKRRKATRCLFVNNVPCGAGWSSAVRRGGWGVSWWARWTRRGGAWKEKWNRADAWSGRKRREVLDYGILTPALSSSQPASPHWICLQPACQPGSQMGSIKRQISTYERNNSRTGSFSRKQIY